MGETERIPSAGSESPEVETTGIACLPERAGQPDGARPAAEAERQDSPALSAEEMDRLLVKGNRVGNRIRFKFMRTFRAFAEGHLYLALGYSSIHQYAELRFQYSRTFTDDLLRVARALPGLPRSEKAFRDGSLGWSVVKAISQVATEKTEAEWIAFASGKSVRRVEKEVEHAVRERRTGPRKNAFGLPGLRTKVVLDFSPVEHELFVKALKKIAAEAEPCLDAGSEGDGAEPPEAGTTRQKRLSTSELLVLLAERILATDPSMGRKAFNRALYTLMVRHCPRCNLSHVLKGEDWVEVPPDVLRRIRPMAEEAIIRPEDEIGPVEGLSISEDNLKKLLAELSAEEIDVPTPLKMRQRVLQRDGHVCSNPCCRRSLGLQAHHIVFRSRRGKTEMVNLLTVCDTCHSLLHHGFLRVFLLETGELRWVAKGSQESLSPEEEERQEAQLSAVIGLAEPLSPSEMEAAASLACPEDCACPEDRACPKDRACPEDGAATDAGAGHGAECRASGPNPREPASAASEEEPDGSPRPRWEEEPEPPPPWSEDSEDDVPECLEGEVSGTVSEADLAEHAAARARWETGAGAGSAAAGGAEPRGPGDRAVERPPGGPTPPERSREDSRVHERNEVLAARLPLLGGRPALLLTRFPKLSTARWLIDALLYPLLAKLWKLRVPEKEADMIVMGLEGELKASGRWWARPQLYGRETPRPAAPADLHPLLRAIYPELILVGFTDAEARERVGWLEEGLVERGTIPSRRITEAILASGRTLTDFPWEVPMPTVEELFGPPPQASPAAC